MAIRTARRWSQTKTPGMQREQQNNEVLEQYKNQNTVSQFFMEHPEYPNTDQANNALETIINRNGWEWTPDSMAAAHALAVQHRVYQPLSQQEIAVANGYAPEAHRPMPPPMLRAGKPGHIAANTRLYTYAARSAPKADSRGADGRKIMARARVNYTIPAKNFRALVYWAHGGVCSMVGKAYCRPEERKLVMDWARDLGLLPPENFYRPPDKETQHHLVRERLCRNIEATAKLASDPGPDEIRRREIAGGRKAKEKAVS